MSYKFIVSDVARAQSPLTATPLHEALPSLVGTPVEACAGSASHLVACTRHGFVEAVRLAFAEHYPLVLTPDAVWLCLAQGFATHVRLHSEALRKSIVEHEGRQDIQIRRDDFVKGRAENPWPEVFAAFSDAIAVRASKERNLVVSDFSTTGPIERAASELVLMDSMQEYFQYSMMTACGIPTITLAGTAEDWRKIRQRVELFAEYDLSWWVSALRTVLDQFVAAATGQEDRNFWTSFLKLNNESGGPYLTGWINVLLPYLAEDPKQPTRNQYVAAWREGLTANFGGGARLTGLPPGLSRVPFEWKVFEKIYPMELLGGFVGVTQEPDSLALRPAVGWAVREVPEVRDAKPESTWARVKQKVKLLMGSK